MKEAVREVKRLDIYIKPKKKVKIIGKKIVFVKDIADIFVSGGTNNDLGQTPILSIKEDKEKSYLISIMDIVKALNQKLPDATISNVGEMDIVVQYMPKAKNNNKILMYLKIALICVILFAGGATAIMSFHADGEIPQIFQGYYHMFFGKYAETPSIIIIPYNIGIALGIIIFFNHFSKIYITKDPTPIEVQMSTYEKETTDNIIDTLEKNKEGEIY